MSFISQSSYSDPCPVCGKTDGTCKLVDTGTQVCRRPGQFPGEEVNGWRFVSESKNPTFFNYRPANEEFQPRTPEELAEIRARQEAEREAKRESDLLSTALMFELMEPLPALAKPGELSVATLRKALDIPCKHVARLRPHRSGPDGNTYVFPMVDGEGIDVGLARRHHASGDKKFLYTTGLVVPKDLKRDLLPPLTGRQVLEQRETGERIWPKDWIHPRLHLVEGPTDCLACLDMGLPSIGRPNNVGGAEQTADWLASNVPDFGKDLHFPAIVVWGENDFDPHSKNPERGWPGRDGALRYGHKLANLHGAPVLVVLPPHDHRGKRVKDLRDWLQAVLVNGKKDDRTPRRAGILLEQYLYRIEQDAMGKRCWLILPGDPLPCPELPTKPKVDAKRVLLTAAIAGTLQPEYDYGIPDATPEERAENEARWERLHSLEHAGAVHHSIEFDSPVNPCDRPVLIGLENQENWDAAEMRKRCGVCPNCLRHKVACDVLIIRAQLAAAMRAGRQVYYAQVPADRWDCWRKAFNDSPDFDHKAYRAVKVYDDQGQHAGYYVLTTDPTRGVPLSPGDDLHQVLDVAETDIRPYLEAAAERGGVRSSASRRWSKSALPKPPSGWKFKADLEEICNEEQSRIVNDLGLTERYSRYPDSDEVISFRVYSKPGGWTDEERERFWRMRTLGTHLADDVEFTFTCSREPAPDTWADEGPAYPDTFA